MSSLSRMRSVKASQKGTRSCSGVASLLSIRTPLFTTAAFVQNWVLIAPSLLKDCTTLLIIAVRIGHRNVSSLVSSPSKSTSKSPGRPTTCHLFRVTMGLGFLTALIPILTTASCRAFFASLCLRQLFKN